MDLLDTLQSLSAQRYVPPCAIALVYAGLGQQDLTFEWLEAALRSHDVHTIFLPVDPNWDGFRKDPRFLSILSRCDFHRIHGT